MDQKQQKTLLRLAVVAAASVVPGLKEVEIDVSGVKNIGLCKHKIGHELKLDTNKHEFIIYVGKLRTIDCNSLDYYFQPHKWYVLIRPIPATSFVIFVKTITGKTITLDVCPTTTVQELKKMIYWKCGQPIDTQRLIFAGKMFADDDQTLQILKIQKESTIHSVLSSRGGGGGPFDFNSLNSMKTQEWSDLAPPWRTVAPGMTIEGKCLTDGCIAKDKTVICNVGFGRIDIQIDRQRFKCPICDIQVEATTCGFNRCVFITDGEKADGTFVQTPFKMCGDNYSSFDEGGGMCKWTKLQFEVVPRKAALNWIQELNSCINCLSKLSIHESLCPKCK